MTTFDQAIANLQQNSNQMAASAKGYNVDVAKFETKKAQDLSRLFLLAGEAGKEISTRLAERKVRQEEAEEKWNLMKGWGTPDPDFKDTIKQIKKDQVKVTDAVGDANRAGKLTQYPAQQVIKESGIGDDDIAIIDIQNKAVRAKSWIANEIATNSNTFIATLLGPDGKEYPQEIAINATNLSREEQKARLDYLFKQYVHSTTEGLNPDFLTYSEEDGGSGYADLIISQYNDLSKGIELNANIQDGINQRNKALQILSDTTNLTEETFQSAMSLFFNSSNLEGTGMLRRDKAWKELIKLMKEGVKSKTIEREQLDKIVKLAFTDPINGNKNLAEHLPHIFGTGEDGTPLGSMYQDLGEFEKKEAEFEEERLNGVKNTKAEKLLNFYKDNRDTMDPVQDKKEIREKLFEWGFDEEEVNEWMEKFTALPDAETDRKVEGILEKFDELFNNKDSDVALLEEYIASFHPDVKDHPAIKARTSLQNKLVKENEQALQTIAKMFKADYTDETGLQLKDFKNNTVKSVFAIAKGELIRRLETNELLGDKKENPRVIITQFEQELSEKIGRLTLSGKWEDYDKDKKGVAEKNLGDNPQKDLQKLINELDSSPFAVDTKGVYRNLLKHPSLSKEFKKSILDEIALKKRDLNSPTPFSEETEFFNKFLPKKERDTFDYNKAIQKKKGVTDELKELCSAKKITLTECIKQRSEALGITLEDDTIKILNGESEGHDRKLDNALASNNSNGFKTNSELAANVTKYELTPLSASLGLYGEKSEQLVEALKKSNPFLNNLIDAKTDEWTPGGLKQGGQVFLGQEIGTLLGGFGPTAMLDLKDAEEYSDLIKGVSSEDKLAFIEENNNASVHAYKASGNLAFLNKLPNPKLDQKRIDDKNSLLALLDEIRAEIPSPTDEDFSGQEISPESEDPTASDLDVIGDSLNTNYTLT